HVGVQPPRQAGQQGRVDEDDDLVRSHVDAEGLGHATAASQGPDGPARARIEQVAGGPHGQQHDEPDQVVDVAAVAQRKAQEVDGLDAGDAVVLAQELEVAEQVVQRQAPGDGAQGQIVPGQPKGDGAQNIGHREGDDQARHQGKPGRPARGGGEVGGGISADAHEGRLAERGQAAHAGKQYEPQHDQGGKPDVIELGDPEFGRARPGRQQRHDDEENNQDDAVHDYSSSST